VRRNTTKTDAGERIIPLNSGAWAVILESRERAKLLFGSEPQPGWYVFPHAEGLRNPDPTKPMTGWRTAWRNLTRVINCPACGKQQKTGEKCRNIECGADISKVKSPLHGLRFHDLRHHAITELSESQASDQTIMSIAGHISPKMLAHFSHVRLDAKRKALDALSGGGSGGGYGTNGDTKPPADSTRVSQVMVLCFDKSSAKQTYGTGKDQYQNVLRRLPRYQDLANALGNVLMSGSRELAFDVI